MSKKDISKNSSKKFTSEDSHFNSQGTKCAGILYRPKDISDPPIVIMAHGFAAEMAFGLPPFAERFAEEGMAVFLFDYRCFGASDGEPRNLVSPSRHLQDWNAAIAHVRNLNNIDKNRIALWGSSFSGGHVIVTASRDHNISAIVSQVPFVDGVATVLRTGIVHAMKATLAYIIDLLKIITFRSPYYVPVIAKPDTFAMMNTPESFPGYMSIVPDNTSWRNECPARVVLPLLFYRPVSLAKRVKCPALLILAENDSLISPKSVRKTASNIAESTLVNLPVGHFDIYTGDVFKEVIEIELDFLKKHLM